jgi:hypothetical protein
MGIRPEQFPYVEICPDCGGAGVEWIEDYQIVSWGGLLVRDETFSVECVACQGKGGLIPKEWING